MEQEEKLSELETLKRMQDYLAEQFMSISEQEKLLLPFHRKATRVKMRLDHANTAANISNAFANVTKLLRTDNNGPSTPEGMS